MRRVAVATCAGTNVDPEAPLLLRSLADVGVDAREVVWDDPAIDWDGFDLVVLRSTWDYAPRRSQFLAWAHQVKNLVNPFDVVAWSSDKHYLTEVAQRGHRIVPTTFCEVGALPLFPDGDFVVKPSVGAGSIDADRYQSDGHERARAHVDRLHAQGRSVMIQPYVPTVDSIGERALIFIDGSFSHAMTKGAMLNVAATDRDFLFRREQMSRATPEPEALALADRLLHDMGFADLLYARVDLVSTVDGWSLMELELVEPSLFLAFDERASGRLAQGVRRRLD